MRRYREHDPAGEFLFQPKGTWRRVQAKQRRTCRGGCFEAAMGRGTANSMVSSR
jgi:hypothetical protein